MTPQVLIVECRTRGITLEVMGDRLRCRAPLGVLTPELKRALADQKAALVQILAAEVPAVSPSEGADESAVMAVKVWSDVLQEAIWVVADDLLCNEWPNDAGVYTHTEVKILRQVGPDTLAWVHAAKERFTARVVDSHARPQV
jgi:tubulysin polyketide synthase-like protein